MTHKTHPSTSPPTRRSHKAYHHRERAQTSAHLALQLEPTYHLAREGRVYEENHCYGEPQDSAVSFYIS